ncbi:hypothetical protein ACLBWX_12670 [Methylobacterium sp. M6A4_1b]
MSGHTHHPERLVHPPRGPPWFRTFRAMAARTSCFVYANQTASCERCQITKACLILVSADPSHIVLFANPTARDLFGGGLSIVAGRLERSDGAVRCAPAQHLGRVENGGAGDRSAGPALILRDDDRSLILQIVSLQTPIEGAALRMASVIVRGTDQARGRPFDPAVVRDLFHLILSEARLAALVGSGSMRRSPSVSRRTPPARYCAGSSGSLA